MNLGNKIASLRKKYNLSQEDLAEKIGVTRQTISKWELEETTPDIKQAKELSKIFKVSLDELTSNDISNILIEKVSNTEKLAGITIVMLKIGLFLFLGLVIIFLLFNIRSISLRDRKIVGSMSISCKLDSDEYLYGVEYNKNYQAINVGGDAWISNHIDIEKYEDANQIIAHIEDYFKEHNGICKVTENKKWGNFIKNIKIIVGIILIIVIIYVLYLFNYIPHKKYNNNYFHIKTYISEVDKDNDGIDDQTDILNNVRKYIETKPKYKSKYYSTGYPDDGYGVCTDVVAFGLRDAGYDLMQLVNVDIKENRDLYNINVIDRNIDFRRVKNLKVYFDNHTIVLTTNINKIEEWQGGDIVIFKNHIGIVSNMRNRRGIPFIIHHANIYQKNYEEDILEYRNDIIGHYRIS